MNFRQWMKAVDDEVFEISSVSASDLNDQPYRDWFDDGIGAEDAANMALDDAGFDFS